MKNWAGNIDYRSGSVARPASVGELSEIVAAASRVKALGTRHSFNTIADTDGVHLVLDDLVPDDLGDGPEIDSVRGVVRVPGGTSYGELGLYLQVRGYALANLASLPHISIAGAIQTGTHGSGAGNGALHTAVRALELVRANGEPERLAEADGDAFLAGVVGLGALGIVTSVELAIEPTFRVRQRIFEDLPWDSVLADFDAIASSAYSVSFFTDFVGDTVSQFWQKVRESDDGPDAEAAAGGAASPGTFHGARAATRPRHPMPEMSAENCTEQLDVPGPWLDRLPHFRREFTPSNGDELQSEYLLPRRHAAAALQQLRGISDRLIPLLYVSEIRTVAGDGFWLSPAYQQDSVAVHLTWKPRQRDVEALLPLVEERLAPFGARPHWGKVFAADAGTIAALYPRLPGFRDMAERLDPSGKFRNRYLDRVIFGD